VAIAFSIAACQGAPVAEPIADATPTAEEAILLGGLRRDAFADCAPIRSGLPDGAVAGIECFPGLADVDRVALFLFDFQPTLLETYFARLAEHGVQPQSGFCGEAMGGEDPYLPGDDGPEPIAERNGCYVDDSGITWVGTLPPFVLAEAHGSGTNRDAFLAWPWKGNLDVPGGPTIWSEHGPVNPEK
jgi:hypothetical protein